MVLRLSAWYLKSAAVAATLCPGCQVHLLEKGNHCRVALDHTRSKITFACNVDLFEPKTKFHALRRHGQKKGIEEATTGGDLIPRSAARTDLKPWRTASLCSCSVGSRPFWKREHERPLQLHRSRQEGQRHTPASHSGSTCADARRSSVSLF
jgi:hypothetical protein